VIGGTSISVDIAVGLCSERRFTFSLNTSRVGNETDLLTQWLVLRQSFALVDKLLDS
jgi:hypothetical protein